jgi:hypothetical protein
MRLNSNQKPNLSILQKLRRRFAATAGASASAPCQPDLTPSASLEAHASALPPADTDDFDYEPHLVPAPVPAPVPVPVAAIEEEQQRHEHGQHERAAPATEALPVAAPEATVVASSSFSEEIAATKIQTAFRGHLVVSEELIASIQSPRYASSETKTHFEQFTVNLGRKKWQSLKILNHR